MSFLNKVIDLQKLNDAWNHIRKNRSASGVDNITTEQFEANRKAEIRELQAEIINGTYHAHPVRQAILAREGKERTISMYCMRDKVIQQSLAQELNRIYESRFPSAVYSYRPKRSALTAVEDNDERVRTGGYEYLLKLDIAAFFDSISWQLLEQMLRRTIREDAVISLIYENVCTDILSEEGNTAAAEKRTY